MFKLVKRVFMITIIMLIALQAFPAAAATTGEKPFAIIEDVYQFGLYRHYKNLYATFDSRDFINAVNALPILKKTDEFSEEPPIAIFSTYCGDDRMHLYQIRPNELRCDDTAYVLSPQQYDALKKTVDQAIPDENSIFHPIWLGYLNTKPVTGITFTGTDGNTRDVLGDNLMLATQQHMSITVSPNNISSYLKKDIDINNLKNSCKTVIKFNNKSYYIIVMQENKLYIESSGRNYGYVYEDAHNKYENATTWDNYKRTMSLFTKVIINPAT